MKLELFLAILVLIAAGGLILWFVLNRVTRDLRREIDRELRRCRMALEKMADTAQEESVANATLRKPVEPDEDLLSDSK